MHLYTIGFTQKRAQKFFELLKSNGVGRLVDIRIKPGGQLAGFAKKEDLPYFLQELAAGCAYLHMPELAPTKEILKDYRDNHDWDHYVVRFESLLDERNVPSTMERGMFEETACCLMCSEATPERCHRRLVAERLARHWPNVDIIHL